MIKAMAEDIECSEEQVRASGLSRGSFPGGTGDSATNIKTWLKRRTKRMTEMGGDG